MCKHQNLLLPLFILCLFFYGCSQKSSPTANSASLEQDTIQTEQEESMASQENTTTEQQTTTTEQENTSTEIPEDIAPTDISSAETYILIEKSLHLLTLYQKDGVKIASYPVGLAQHPIGAKEKEGDKKTPEGEYYVCVKNTTSKFYKALGLSYPNISDANRGFASGLISQEELDSITASINAGTQPNWYTALGGEIMIHGQKNDLGSQKDWTTGCVAVDNETIDAIWDLVEVGTPVTILP